MENYYENEQELSERAINIFYDILNIDISGYIEEVSRIGTRISKRPLKIELLSRRMAQFILQNAQYFKNTGLTVSEYLDKQALNERKSIKRALQIARKHGKHAIIRNNELVVNEKVIDTTHIEKENQKPFDETIIPSGNQNLHQQLYTTSKLTVDNNKTKRQTTNSFHSFRY